MQSSHQSNGAVKVPVASDDLQYCRNLSVIQGVGVPLGLVRFCFRVSNVYRDWLGLPDLVVTSD